MTRAKLNLTESKAVEVPQMEKPMWSDYNYQGRMDKKYLVDEKEYEKQLKSCRTFHINPEDWKGMKDGDVVSGIVGWQLQDDKGVWRDVTEEFYQWPYYKDKRRLIFLPLPESGKEKKMEETQDELHDILVWYQGKGDQYRNETTIDQCVKDFLEYKKIMRIHAEEISKHGHRAWE